MQAKTDIRKVTIEQKWLEYRNACYGRRPLTPNQEKELKQTFYAGVLVFISLTFDISDLSDDEGVTQLERLHKEVTMFLNPIQS